MNESCANCRGTKKHQVLHTVNPNTLTHDNFLMELKSNQLTLCTNCRRAFSKNHSKSVETVDSVVDSSVIRKIEEFADFISSLDTIVKEDFSRFSSVFDRIIARLQFLGLMCQKCRRMDQKLVGGNSVLIVFYAVCYSSSMKNNKQI